MTFAFPNKTALLLLTILSMMVLFARAQTNLLYYHLSDQFNSSGYNPAFLTSQEKFTFSIFPLAGMNVSYNNQAEINKMILNLAKGDTSKQGFKDLFNGLLKRGLFYQRFESSLLNLGYNSDIGSFNFRIREVEQLMNNFKGPFSEFVIDPNFLTIKLNQPQPFPAEAANYREYSLGYANEIIKDKLTVGIRVKLYFGKSAFISDVSGVVVQENGAYYLRTMGQMKLSAPVKVIVDAGTLQPFTLMDNFSVGKYILNPENVGEGIDIGFTYKIDYRTTISASMIDLGRINWKSNLNTLVFKGEHEFPEALIQNQGAGFLTKKPEFVQEMVNNFDLFQVETLKSSYVSNLPTTIYAGLKFEVNPKLNIGIVDRYISKKGLSYNSISITTNVKMNQKLTLTAGYSVIGNSITNFPLGILYDWGWGQTFFGSDNVLSFIFPSFSDFTGITFGTCFYLFRDKVKYNHQTEYLPFYKAKKEKPARKNGLQFKNHSDSPN